MRTQPGNSTIDGRGIGIAVLDSGIFRDHKSFLADDDSNRIIVTRAFTGLPFSLNEDFYGHGTHVAGLLAGGTRSISTAYRGIAPGAKIINLRVLDPEGRGSVSRLLQALDWVIANRKPFCNTDPKLDMSPKLAEHFGSYRTLAAFPIIKDKEVLEAVTLYSISLDEYTAEHQRLLEEAVALLATMLSALSDAGEGNRAGADLGSIDIEAAAMDSELAH